MKTIYRKREKNSTDTPLVTWMQILGSMDKKYPRNGFSIYGRGWSIRGILIMHLERCSARKGGSK